MDIDELLAADGTRWRADEKRAALVPNTMAIGQVQRQRMSPWWSIGAVAAAIVAIGFVLYLVARDPSVSTDAGGLPISPTTVDTGQYLNRGGPYVSTPVPARVIQTDPENPISMPWRLRAVDNDHATITVDYVGGDGLGVNHVGFKVIETDDSVELIAVSSDQDPSPDSPASLCTGTAEITLSEPLGDRQLLHAPTDAGEWPDHLLN